MRGGFPLNKISEYRNEIYGVSILLVVFFHYCGPHIKYYESSIDSSLMLRMMTAYVKYIGSIGVEIFVFLSGMGLYYSFIKNSNVKAFYERRFNRIIIPYLYVGTAFWLVKDIMIKGRPWIAFAKDLLFITFFTDGTKTLWFILFLIIAYFLFPLFFKIIHSAERTRTLAFSILTAASMAVPVALQTLNGELYSNTQIAFTRIPLFIVGIFAGKYIMNNKRIPHIAIFILVIASAVLQFYSNSVGVSSYWDRYISAVFGIAVIIVLVYIFHLIHNALWIRSILRFFGNYSLEIYMLHVTLRNLMKTLKLADYRTIVFAAMMIIAVILSLVLRKLTEGTQRLLFGK